MKLQLNFQIVRVLNYKQRFSDALPHIVLAAAGITNSKAIRMAFIRFDLTMNKNVDTIIFNKMLSLSITISN